MLRARTRWSEKSEGKNCLLQQMLHLLSGSLQYNVPLTCVLMYASINVMRVSELLIWTPEMWPLLYKG